MAAIDDIQSIKGSDLEITKEGDKGRVSFFLRARNPLTGPAWLTLKL